MRALFAFLFLVASATYAADAPNLLRNNQFVKELDSWFLKGADRCKSEATVTSHEKFQRALRLDVTPQAKDMPWSVVLRQTIGAPLQKGKQLVLKAWLRSPEQVQITAFVENAAPPYDKSLTATFRLTNEWQEYEIKGIIKEDLPPGGANCGFFLSHSKGTIRLADVRLFQTDKPEDTIKVEPPRITPPKAELPKVEPPNIEPPVQLPKIEPPVITPPKPAQIVESLLEDEDFERNLNGWTLPVNDTLKAEVVAAMPGELPEPWTRVLKLSSDGEADPLNTRQRIITQKFAASIAPGDGLLVKFWARGPRGSRVSVQAGSTGAPSLLLLARLDVSAEWKAYEARSISHTALRAEQAQLALWNGAIGGSLEIAGLQAERISNVPRDWADPPPVFNFENLFFAPDFSNARLEQDNPRLAQFPAHWQVALRPGVKAEIVDTEAGPYNNALRLTFTPPEPPDPKQPFGFGIFQSFRTPALTNEVFALKFWARSTNGTRLYINLSQTEKTPPPAPGERPKSSRSRTAIGADFPLTAEWREYTFRPDAAILRKIQQDPFVSVNGSCAIFFREPKGTVELTGFRLALERPAEP